MGMTIEFAGGMVVESAYGGHRVRTDQPRPTGGETAPSPFDLFLASLGTCSGFYVLRFCQQRGIDTRGVTLTLETSRGEGDKLERITIGIALPPDFPAKYRKAVLRAADQCAVKKALLDPPELETLLVGQAP